MHWYLVMILVASLHDLFSNPAVFVHSITSCSSQRCWDYSISIMALPGLNYSMLLLNSFGGRLIALVSDPSYET